MKTLLPIINKLLPIINRVVLIATTCFISIDASTQSCNNNISNLRVRSTNTISLYKTWNIYLFRPTFYKVPSLYTLEGSDTVNISNTCASWSVGNNTIASVTNGVVTAKSSGSTTLTATINNLSVTIPLLVNAEVRPVEYEANIDPFLTTPATNSIAQVPVVIICFIPTYDGININTQEAAFSPIPVQTVAELKKHILKISKHTKFSLEEGSRFRGYKDASAIPYVGYKVVDYIYVYEPVPRGFNDPGSSSFFGDYNVIVNRFNGKKYVDSLGVKEFWMMGYHNGEIVPAESNMSSPFTGDISNSYQFADDLPVYSKTYVLYNYNFTREGNEATHNHGHQFESMIDYVARRQDGNTDLFTKNFRGYGAGSGPLGRAGDTHHPPNTRIDYDYNNSTLVASDILDWKPEGGTKTLVNNNTWASINYAWPQGTTPDVESNWYILWMQSFPGYNNKIPYAGTKQMTNWWEFLSNWDNTTINIGLYKPLPITCTPPTFVNNNLIILDATCANNDGNINIIPTSGTAPFMYSINGGVTYVAGPNAGYGFQNLSSGTYQLRLKDANGCESSIVERQVKLNCTTTCTPPTFVNNGLIILDATCANNDGNINIIPTSGTAPFMYSINGGTTYVAGPNAGYGFQNLPSGTYKLRLKDANGCESAIVEREVKLLCNACTPPTFINNGLIVLDASCGKSDGSINIIPTSGIAPFMYSINGGTTYVAGPNAGYGFQNLSAGTYQLRLKDARGCESAIGERTVRNYYNCPGITVSTNPSEASLALSNKDVIVTYPNPSKGQFKLLLQNFQSSKAEVSIFDAKGTLIQKRSLNLTQNTIADFNLKGKAAGLYYIKVVSSDGTKVQKVLIQ
jgi:hypothetical protein